MASTQGGASPAMDLTRFDEEYSKAPGTEEDYYKDIADGPYDAVIEEARLTETASTGRPVVIWTLRITGPQAMNRILYKNRVITEKTLPWLKEDLQKCGLVLAKFSELPSRIGELSGRAVSIEKRTKDGRGNIYFRWTTRRPAEISDNDLPF